MSAIWCELAWLGGEQPEPSVLLTLQGERFATVQTGAAPPPGALRLPGLTLPGFANAHSHSFQRALRGRTQRCHSGSFWSWREQMYELAMTLDPCAFEALARATFAEMALAGVTLVGEFHYLHHNPDGTPYAEANLLGEAVIRAASAAGIRLTLLDTCYLEGGLPRFRDADADAWAARVTQLAANGTVRIGAAIHSVRAVDSAGAATVAELARRNSWPLHVHVSEQPNENEVCLERCGVTPTELLDEIGVLTVAPFTAVHATHLTVADIARLGAAPAHICMCPSTERDLADGVGPAYALAQAGASLALGSDSNAFINLLEEARAVELDERLATGVRGSHAPSGLARAATAGGYASLGWPEGGRIEPGALADLTTLSLDTPRLAGTRAADALDAAIFASDLGDIHSVIVGGRQIVRDGSHVALDVPAELRAALV